MEHKSYSLTLRITSLIVAIAFIFTTLSQDLAWAYQTKHSLNRPLVSANFKGTPLEQEVEESKKKLTSIFETGIIKTDTVNNAPKDFQLKDILASVSVKEAGAIDLTDKGLIFVKNTHPPIFIMDDHGWAYAAWHIIKAILGFGPVTLIHVDSHPDVAFPKTQFKTPATAKEASSIKYSEDSFIMPAFDDGIFENMLWVKGPHGYLREFVQGGQLLIAKFINHKQDDGGTKTVVFNFSEKKLASLKEKSAILDIDLDYFILNGSQGEYAKRYFLIFDDKPAILCEKNGEFFIEDYDGKIIKQVTLEELKQSFSHSVDKLLDRFKGIDIKAVTIASSYRHAPQKITSIILEQLVNKLTQDKTSVVSTGQDLSSNAQLHPDILGGLDFEQKKDREIITIVSAVISTPIWGPLGFGLAVASQNFLRRFKLQNRDSFSFSQRNVPMFAKRPLIPKDTSPNIPTGKGLLHPLKEEIVAEKKELPAKEKEALNYNISVNMLLLYGVDKISKLLDDERWWIRVASADAIGKMVIKRLDLIDEDTFIKLRRLLDDSHPKVVEAACSAIGNISVNRSDLIDEDIIDKLAEFLNHRTLEVSLASITAICKIAVHKPQLITPEILTQAYQLLDPIKKGLKKDKVYQKICLLIGLISIHRADLIEKYKDEVLPLLYELPKHLKTNDALRTVAKTIRQICQNIPRLSERISDDLYGLMADSNKVGKVRQTAIIAMGLLYPVITVREDSQMEKVHLIRGKIKNRLLKCRKDEYAGTSQAAVEAIGRVGISEKALSLINERMVDGIFEIFSHPNEDMRLLAARALSRIAIARKTMTEGIEVKDISDEIRDWILKKLHWLLKNSKDYREIQTASLAIGYTSLEREDFVDEDIIDRLYGFSYDVRPEVRQASIEAIGNITVKRADLIYKDQETYEKYLNRLKELLTDTNEKIRRSSVIALGQMIKSVKLFEIKEIEDLEFQSLNALFQLLTADNINAEERKAVAHSIVQFSANRYMFLNEIKDILKKMLTVDEGDIEKWAKWHGLAATIELVGDISKKEPNIIDREIVKRLYELLDYKGHGNVKRFAARTLGFIGLERPDLMNEAIVKRLYELLSEHSKGVASAIEAIRQEAMEAIGRISTNRMDLIYPDILIKLYNLINAQKGICEFSIETIGLITTGFSRFNIGKCLQYKEELLTEKFKLEGKTLACGYIALSALVIKPEWLRWFLKQTSGYLEEGLLEGGSNNIKDLCRDIEELYFLDRPGLALVLDRLLKEDRSIPDAAKYLKEQLREFRELHGIKETFTQDGFIHQGSISAHKFGSRLDEIRKNDVTDDYKARLKAMLGKGMPMTLEIKSQLEKIINDSEYKIYEFNSIVEGPDDFFLGYHDIDKKELFVATDLIAELENRGPPSLVDEYFLHEVICPALRHYQSIAMQQIIFSQHYTNQAKFIQKDNIKYIKDQPDKIYKGILGENLRRFINNSISKKSTTLPQRDFEPTRSKYNALKVLVKNNLRLFLDRLNYEDLTEEEKEILKKNGIQDKKGFDEKKSSLKYMDIQFMPRRDYLFWEEDGYQLLRISKAAILISEPLLLEKVSDKELMVLVVAAALSSIGFSYKSLLKMRLGKDGQDLFNKIESIAEEDRLSEGFLDGIFNRMTAMLKRTSSEERRKEAIEILSYLLPNAASFLIKNISGPQDFARSTDLPRYPNYIKQRLLKYLNVLLGQLTQEDLIDFAKAVINNLPKERSYITKSGKIYIKEKGTYGQLSIYNLNQLLQIYKDNNIDNLLIEILKVTLAYIKFPKEDFIKSSLNPLEELLFISSEDIVKKVFSDDKDYAEDVSYIITKLIEIGKVYKQSIGEETDFLKTMQWTSFKDKILQAIIKISSVDPEVCIWNLRHKLTDPKAPLWCRVLIADVIGEVGRLLKRPDKAVSALGKILENKDKLDIYNNKTLKEICILALGKIGTDQAAKLLMYNLIGEEDRGLRFKYLAAIGHCNIKAEELKAVIIKGLATILLEWQLLKDEMLMINCLNTIINIGSNKAVDALVDAYNTIESQKIKKTCRDGLYKLYALGNDYTKEKLIELGLMKKDKEDSSQNIFSYDSEWFSNVPLLGAVFSFIYAVYKGFSYMLSISSGNAVPFAVVKEPFICGVVLVGISLLYLWQQNLLTKAEELIKIAPTRAGPYGLIRQFEDTEEDINPEFDKVAYVKDGKVYAHRVVLTYFPPHIQFLFFVHEQGHFIINKILKFIPKVIQENKIYKTIINGTVRRSDGTKAWIGLDDLFAYAIQLPLLVPIALATLIYELIDYVKNKPYSDWREKKATPVRAKNIDSLIRKLSQLQKSLPEDERSLLTERISKLNDFKRELLYEDSISLIPEDGILAKYMNELIRPWKDKNWRSAKIPSSYTIGYFWFKVLKLFGYFDEGPTEGVDPFRGIKDEAALEAIEEYLEEYELEPPKNKEFINKLLLKCLKAGKFDPSANLVETEEIEVSKDEREYISERLLKAGLKRLDIICDNAGPELLADLRLARYLLDNGLVEKVNIHLKGHPFVISDVTVQDAERLIQNLREHTSILANELGESLSSYINEGKISLETNIFWTSGDYFKDMPQELAQDLAESDLVIIKGDLNYRRLVGKDMLSPDIKAKDVVDLAFNIAVIRIVKSLPVLDIGKKKFKELSKRWGRKWYERGIEGTIQYIPCKSKLERKTQERLSTIEGKLNNTLKNRKIPLIEWLQDKITLLSMLPGISLLTSWFLENLGDSSTLRKIFFFAMPFIKWLCGRFILLVDPNIKETDGTKFKEEMEKVVSLIQDKKEERLDVTLDNVGDAAASLEDTRIYINFYKKIIKYLSEKEGLDEINLSIKLSALSCGFDKVRYYNDKDASSKQQQALQKMDEIKKKLIEILDVANSVKGKKVFIRIDMEEYAYKDATLAIFKELVEKNPALALDNEGQLRLGIVIQGYLRDSGKDLMELLSWAKNNNLRVPVRLVKGAYDKKEKKWAKDRDDDKSPVFTYKESTDANYELLSKFLIDNIQHFRPAFATHNIRSMARVMALAEYAGVENDKIEFQMLHGMGDEIKRIIVGMGYKMRIYVPAGTLAKGMKYSGRRFIELTSQDNALTKTLRGIYTHLKDEPKFQKGDEPSITKAKQNFQEAKDMLAKEDPQCLDCILNAEFDETKVKLEVKSRFSLQRDSLEIPLSTSTYEIYLALLEAIFGVNKYFTRSDTQFDRHEAFTPLQTTYLMELLKEKIKKQDRKLNIWSAGCSTGEEARTYIRMLEENLKELGEDIFKWDIIIWGTDINKNRLKKAREFKDNDIESRISELNRRKEFGLPLQYNISDELRNHIKLFYFYLNLDSPYQLKALKEKVKETGGFDIISFILVYPLKEEKKTIETMQELLTTGGLLVTDKNTSLELLWPKEANLPTSKDGYRCFIYKKSSPDGFNRGNSSISKLISFIGILVASNIIAILFGGCSSYIRGSFSARSFDLATLWPVLVIIGIFAILIAFTPDKIKGEKGFNINRFSTLKFLLGKNTYLLIKTKKGISYFYLIDSSGNKVADGRLEHNKKVWIGRKGGTIKTNIILVNGASINHWDKDISRQHLFFVRRGDIIYITDHGLDGKGSKFGTYRIKGGIPKPAEPSEDTPNVSSINAYDQKSHDEFRADNKATKQIQIWGSQIEGTEFNQGYSDILRGLLPDIPNDVNIMLIDRGRSPPEGQHFLYYDKHQQKWIFSHAGTRNQTGKFIYLPLKAFQELIKTQKGKSFLSKLIPDEAEHATLKLEGRWSEDFHKDKDNELRKFVEEEFLPKAHLALATSGEAKNLSRTPYSPVNIAEFKKGKLTLKVTQDYEAMSQRAYEDVSRQMKDNIKKYGKTVMVFPTGGTPKRFYELLAKDPKIDWSKVICFNLDEYAGLTDQLREDPDYCYRKFMFEHLYSKVIPKGLKRENIHSLDTSAKDLQAECRRYEDELMQALNSPNMPSDSKHVIVVLGIGPNGHIAFNEPGTSFNSRTHVVNLDSTTIKANSRFFVENIISEKFNKERIRIVNLEYNNTEALVRYKCKDGKSIEFRVPRKAMTTGLGTLKDLSKRANSYILAAGDNKAKPMYDSLYGPVTERIPASLLQEYENAIAIIDTHASSLLPIDSIAVVTSMGGTKYACGLVDKDSNIYSQDEFNWMKEYPDVDQDALAQHLFEKVSGQIDRVGIDRIKFVGIAFAGPIGIDEDDGILKVGYPFACSNQPFYKFPLKSILEQKIKTKYGRALEVKIINDAEAALKGEIKSNNLNSISIMIIGTGINISVSLDGRPYFGKYGEIKELGHNLVPTGILPAKFKHLASKSKYTYLGLETKGGHPADDEGRPLKGDLEDSCSGPNLARRWLRLIKRYPQEIDYYVQRIKDSLVEEGLKFDYVRDFERLSKILSISVDKLSSDEKSAKPVIVKAILEAITDKAKEGDTLANKWIKKIARQLGYAIASFLYAYKDQEFIKDFILVSGVSENLGKGVLDEEGKDLFINAIKKALYRELINLGLDEKEAELLSIGIERSKMGYEREFVAFAEFIDTTKAHTPDGFIHQEKNFKVKEEFESRLDEIRQNNITDKYRDRIIKLLKAALSNPKLSSKDKSTLKGQLDKLKDYKIYGFDSIVKGPNDFFLGYNDIENKELFVATDLIAELENRGPPTPVDTSSQEWLRWVNPPSLVDEYLLHEVMCPILFHYPSIFAQQTIFPAHYPNKKQLLKQSSEKPYKGLLGEVLREIIDQASRPLKSVTVAVNLMDLGAEVIDGKVICRNSLKKAKELLSILAKSGVGSIYLYGGLYEMSDMSEEIHQIPSAHRYFVTSEDERVTVMVSGYDTKRKVIGGIELKDTFGNPFSVFSMSRLNSLISDTDVINDLKEFIDEAHKLGIKVTADFIPWLAPDAINETNYKWTFYKELTNEENEYYRSCSKKKKEEFVKSVLRRNNSFFAVKIIEKGIERVILVKHLQAGGDNYNADQVILNPFLPEVQQYYIDSIKALIDLGIDEVRADLPHMILKKHMGRYLSILTDKQIAEFDIVNQQEPWQRIINEAKEYAKAKNRTIKFNMEAYDYEDQVDLSKLGADSFYYKGIFEDWYKMRMEGMTARNLTASIKYLIDNKIAGGLDLKAYASNFDQTSLKAIGDPTEGLTMLLIILAHLGLPIMVDLREWMGHEGHIVPMVGGTGERKSLHLFVAEDEFNKRNNFENLKKEVKKGSWSILTKEFFDKISTKEERCIQFLDNSNLDKFVTFSWKAEDGNWKLFVFNTNPQGTKEPMWVEVPPQIAEEGLDKFSIIDTQNNRKLNIDILESDGKKYYRIPVEFNGAEEYKLISCNLPKQLDDNLTSQHGTANISIGTQNVKDKYIEEMFDRAIKSNFTAFEVFFRDFLPQDIKPDFRAWLKREAQRNNIALTVHAPWWHKELKRRYCPIEDYEVFKDTILFAKDVGAKVVTIHLTKPTKAYAKAIRRLAKLAKEHGIRIAIENTDLTSGRQCNPKDLKKVLGYLSDLDNVGICFDMGHANLSGMSPVRYLKSLGKRIKIFNVHFHNNDGKEDHHWSMKDERGNIDFKAVLAELVARGYDSSIIIEHGRPSLAEEREFINDILQPPISTTTLKDVEPQFLQNNPYAQALREIVLGKHVTSESIDRCNVLRKLGPQIEEYVRHILYDKEVKIAIIPMGSVVKGYADAISDVEYRLIIMVGKGASKTEGGEINYKLYRLIEKEGFKGEPMLTVPTAIPSMSNVLNGHLDIGDFGTEDAAFDFLSSLFLPIAYGDAEIIERARKNVIILVNKQKSPEQFWSRIREEYFNHLKIQSFSKNVKPHLEKWLVQQGVDPNSLSDFNNQRAGKLGLPAFNEMMNIYHFDPSEIEHQLNKIDSEKTSSESISSEENPTGLGPGTWDGTADTQGDDGHMAFLSERPVQPKEDEEEPDRQIEEVLEAKIRWDFDPSELDLHDTHILDKKEDEVLFNLEDVKKLIKNLFSKDNCKFLFDSIKEINTSIIDLSIGDIKNIVIDAIAYGGTASIYKVEVDVKGFDKIYFGLVVPRSDGATNNIVYNDYFTLKSYSKKYPKYIVRPYVLGDVIEASKGIGRKINIFSVQWLSHHRELHINLKENSHNFIVWHIEKEGRLDEHFDEGPSRLIAKEIIKILTICYDPDKKEAVGINYYDEPLRCTIPINSGDFVFCRNDDRTFSIYLTTIRQIRTNTDVSQFMDTMLHIGAHDIESDEEGYPIWFTFAAKEQILEGILLGLVEKYGKEDGIGTFKEWIAKYKEDFKDRIKTEDLVAIDNLLGQDLLKIAGQDRKLRLSQKEFVGKRDAYFKSIKGKYKTKLPKPPYEDTLGIDLLNEIAKDKDKLKKNFPFLSKGAIKGIYNAREKEPFTSWSKVLRIKGIGDSILGRIKVSVKLVQIEEKGRRMIHQNTQTILNRGQNGLESISSEENPKAPGPETYTIGDEGSVDSTVAALFDLPTESGPNRPRYYSDGKKAVGRTAKILRDVDNLFISAMSDREKENWTEFIHKELKKYFLKIIKTCTDPKEAYKAFVEIFKAARKEGKWFLVYTIIIEIMQDAVIPSIATYLFGPGLGALLFTTRAEPVTVPLYFMIKKILEKKMSKKAFNEYFAKVERSILEESTLEKRWKRGAKLKEKTSLEHVLGHFYIRLKAKYKSNKKSTSERIGIRETAAKTLGILLRQDKIGELPSSQGRQEAFELLIRRCKDRDVWVRKAVYGALGKIRDPDAIPCLEEGLNDPDPRVKGAAIRSLGMFGQAVKDVIPLLSKMAMDEEENIWVRIYCIGALGYIGEDLKNNASRDLIETLFKFAKSEHQGLKVTAVEALARLLVSDKKITEVLKDCLDDKDPSVGEVALWGLVRKYRVGDKTISKSKLEEYLLKFLYGQDTKMRDFSCSILNSYFGYSLLKIKKLQKEKAVKLPTVDCLNFITVDSDKEMYEISDKLRQDGNTVFKARDFEYTRNTRPIDKRGFPIVRLNINREAVISIFSKVIRGETVCQPIIDRKRGKEAREISVMPSGKIYIIGNQEEIKEFKRIIQKNIEVKVEEIQKDRFGIGLGTVPEDEEKPHNGALARDKAKHVAIRLKGKEALEELNKKVEDKIKELNRPILVAFGGESGVGKTGLASILSDGKARIKAIERDKYMEEDGHISIEKINEMIKDINDAVASNLYDLVIVDGFDILTFERYGIQFDIKVKITADQTTRLQNMARRGKPLDRLYLNESYSESRYDMVIDNSENKVIAAAFEFDKEDKKSLESLEAIQTEKTLEDMLEIVPEDKSKFAAKKGYIDKDYRTYMKENIIPDFREFIKIYPNKEYVQKALGAILDFGKSLSDKKLSFSEEDYEIESPAVLEWFDWASFRILELAKEGNLAVFNYDNDKDLENWLSNLWFDMPINIYDRYYCDYRVLKTNWYSGAFMYVLKIWAYLQGALDSMEDRAFLKSDFVKNIFEEGNILEIAPGKEPSISRINRLYPNADIFAIDPNFRAVRFARQQHNLISKRASVYKTDFEDNKFNYIFAMDSLTYAFGRVKKEDGTFEYPGAKEAADELYRIMAVGGYGVFFFGKYDITDELFKIFEEAGFEILTPLEFNLPNGLYHDGAWNNSILIVRKKATPWLLTYKDVISNDSILDMDEAKIVLQNEKEGWRIKARIIRLLGADKRWNKDVHKLIGFHEYDKITEFLKGAEIREGRKDIIDKYHYPAEMPLRDAIDRCILSIKPIEHDNSGVCLGIQATLKEKPIEPMTIEASTLAAIGTRI